MMKIDSPKNGNKKAVMLLGLSISYTLLSIIVYGIGRWYYYSIIVIFLLIVEFFCAISNRAYKLDQSGITVYWFGKFSRHHGWQEFESIRVATIKVRMRDWHYPRCLIFSKHALPKPLVKASYSWFERHPFSTLLFELTPERYEEFCEKFPDIKLEWESTY